MFLAKALLKKALVVSIKLIIQIAIYQTYRSDQIVLYSTGTINLNLFTRC